MFTSVLEIELTTTGNGNGKVVKRIFSISSSKAVIIDPTFVKELQLDDSMFFEQRKTKQGLLLIPRKLV